MCILVVFPATDLPISCSLEIQRQQSRTQQAIMARKQELSIAQARYQDAENMLNRKNLELNHLEAQHETIQRGHEKLLAQCREHTRDLIIYKERCDQQQKNLQSQEHGLTEKINVISQLEKHLAILNDQVNRLEKSRAQAEDKIETLRQEKLFLTQEKAELQGCLKQLETIK